MLLLLHALIPCLAAYILHLFLYFLALSSQHFNGNVFTPLFHWFFVAYSLANTMLLCLFEPHPILLLVVMWYARV